MHDARHDAQHAPTAPALAPTEVAPAFETPHAELRDALIGEAAGPWYDALRQEVAERDAGVDRSVSTASNAYRLDRMTGGSEAVPEAVAARLAGRTHTDPAEREAARAQLGAMAELLGSKPFIGLDDPLEHKDPRAVRESREHGRRKAKNKRGKRAEEARQEQETARAEGEQARAQEGVDRAAKAGTSEVGGALAAAPGVSAPAPAVPQPAPVPAPAASPRAALQQAGDALGAQDFAPGLAAGPGAGASAPAVQGAPAASAAPAAPDGDLARAFMNHHWDASHWEAIRAEAGVLREEESWAVERIAGSEFYPGPVRDALLTASTYAVSFGDAAWGLLPLPPNPFRLGEAFYERTDTAMSDLYTIAEVDTSLLVEVGDDIVARAVFGMLADSAGAIGELAYSLDALAAASLAIGGAGGASVGSSSGPAGAAGGGLAGAIAAGGLAAAWMGLSPLVHTTALATELIAGAVGGVMDASLSARLALAGHQARHDGRVLDQDALSQMAAARLGASLEVAGEMLGGMALRKAMGKSALGFDEIGGGAKSVSPQQALNEMGEGMSEDAFQEGLGVGVKAASDGAAWTFSGVVEGIGGVIHEVGLVASYVSDLTDKGVRFAPVALSGSSAASGPLRSAREATSAHVAAAGAALRGAPDPIWTPRGLEAALTELDAGVWRKGSYLRDASRTADFLADMATRAAADHRVRWLARTEQIVSDAARAVGVAGWWHRQASDVLALAQAERARSAVVASQAALGAASLEWGVDQLSRQRSALEQGYALLPETLRAMVGPGVEAYLGLLGLHEGLARATAIPLARSAVEMAASAHEGWKQEVAHRQARADEALRLLQEACAVTNASQPSVDPSTEADDLADQLRLVSRLLQSEVPVVAARRAALRARVESEAPAEIDAWVGAHGQAVEDYFQPEAPTPEIDAIGEVVNALRDENLLNADDHDEALALRAAAESEVGRVGQAAVARVWAVGDRVAELADQAEARGGAPEPDTTAGTTTP